MYPIHFFVDARGVRVRANDTDQADWALNEANRVRTCTTTDDAGEKIRRIVVSAGLWNSSQLAYRPFLQACSEAAEEAAKLEQRGHCVFRKRNTCTAAEFAALAKWPAPGKRPRAKLLRAIELVFTQGYHVAAAARVMALSKTQKNGERELQRALKGWRSRLAEMRAMSAHAALDGEESQA